MNHVAVCARHLGNLWLPGEPTWTGAERGRHVSDIVGDTVFVFSSHSIYNYKFVFLGLLEDLFCNCKICNFFYILYDQKRIASAHGRFHIFKIQELYCLYIVNVHTGVGNHINSVPK